MKTEDFEEAHYWWVINEVIDLIRTHGYNTVLSDINECLNPIKEDKSALKDSGGTTWSEE